MWGGDGAVLTHRVDDKTNRPPRVGTFVILLCTRTKHKLVHSLRRIHGERISGMFAHARTGTFNNRYIIIQSDGDGYFGKHILYVCDKLYKVLKAFQGEREAKQSCSPRGFKFYPAI